MPPEDYQQVKLMPPENYQRVNVIPREGCHEVNAILLEGYPSVKAPSPKPPVRLTIHGYKNGQQSETPTQPVLGQVKELATGARSTMLRIRALSTMMRVWAIGIGSSTTWPAPVILRQTSKTKLSIP